MIGHVGFGLLSLCEGFCRPMMVIISYDYECLLAVGLTTLDRKSIGRIHGQIVHALSSPGRFDSQASKTPYYNK